jgi:hypothetical protein
MVRKSFDEAVLATAVCHQLWRSGWVPYPELAGLADIVAHNPETDDILAIEAKAAVNFKVVSQADSGRTWTRVDGVYVAVPTHGTYSRYLRILCAELGIGVIEVAMGYAGRVNSMTITPCRRRGHRDSTSRFRTDLRQLLIPEARDYTIPGRKSPRSFTAFRLRELTLLRILQDRPGLTPKELATAEAEAAGKKKHAARAPTYIRELCERHAFDTFELGDDGRIWPKYAWGAKEAGHEAVSYEGMAFDNYPDHFIPVPKGDSRDCHDITPDTLKEHGYA